MTTTLTPEELEALWLATLRGIDASVLVAESAPEIRDEVARVLIMDPHILELHVVERRIDTLTRYLAAPAGMLTERAVSEKRQEVFRLKTRRQEIKERRRAPQLEQTAGAVKAIGAALEGYRAFK